MSQSDDQYEVTFLPECLNQIERFGALEDFDVAFNQIEAALRKNPYVFKSSPNRPNWIVAITRRYKGKKGMLPSLRVYAAINEALKRVLIVDVDLNPDDPSIYM